MGKYSEYFAKIQGSMRCIFTTLICYSFVCLDLDSSSLSLVKLALLSNCQDPDWFSVLIILVEYAESKLG